MAFSAGKREICLDNAVFLCYDKIGKRGGKLIMKSYSKKWVSCVLICAVLLAAGTAAFAESIENIDYDSLTEHSFGIYGIINDVPMILSFVYSLDYADEEAQAEELVVDGRPVGFTVTGLHDWSSGIFTHPVDGLNNNRFDNISEELVFNGVKKLYEDASVVAVAQQICHFPAEDGLYDLLQIAVMNEFDLSAATPLYTEETDYLDKIEGNYFAEPTGMEYAANHDEYTCSRFSQWLTRPSGFKGVVLTDLSEILDTGGNLVECTIRFTWLDV